MNIRNDNYQERIQAGFASANFVNDVGIRLLECGPGWCETELSVRDRHLQQNGVVHAGVLGTMADHTAGAAATTLTSAEDVVLTLEFKLNLLRPAVGDLLFCRAEVIKPGSTFTVAESSVHAIVNGGRKLVARGTFTMAITRPGHA
jgi:uncharacterized protein (TIGR00369 family)